MPSEENTKEDQYGQGWGSLDYDFICPSGAKCRLRKVDPFDLLERGLLEKLDFVTGVVIGKHEKNARMSNVERIKAQRAARAAGENPEDEEELAKKKAAEELLNDPERMVRFGKTLNSIVPAVVTRPKIELAPEDPEERVQGVIYSDTVPYQDKVAIFSKVMEGVNKLEQFRSGSEETVGAVASKPSVRKPAQRRPARAKAK